jgi:hypothetical protein
MCGGQHRRRTDQGSGAEHAKVERHGLDLADSAPRDFVGVETTAWIVSAETWQ